MRLPLFFARRYLFASRTAAGRSTNAINIITGISIGVIAVVTAAMVVVLSTFNGIAGLVDSMYSPLDQDITITPAQGRTFPQRAVDTTALAGLPGVRRMSWVIEENVLLRNGGQQAVATLKGVQPHYLEMCDMARHLFAGRGQLHSRNGSTVLLGVGLKVDLGVPMDDGVLRPLTISAPIRGRKLGTMQQRAFEHVEVAMSGFFSMNAEYDMKYVIADIELARALFRYDTVVSALEVQLMPGTSMDRVAADLRAMLGPELVVRTRHQKNALMYETNRMEKRFVFLVLVFIGFIGAFNIIASLTMLMIEKRNDMRTLTAMEAPPDLVRRIFRNEGLLIVATGMVIGMVLGLLLCVAQQQFGLLKLQGSVVEHYPVVVQPLDLLIIAATVMAIGALAIGVPLRALQKRFLLA